MSVENEKFYEEEFSEEEVPEEGEEFSELIKYTIPGYILGLLAGIFLDFQGYQRSRWDSGLSGLLQEKGRAFLKGFFPYASAFERLRGSMAEAYGWGKFFGLAFPWAIDLGSRLAGVDVYGVEGFYIPYFYALSDQIGANISGMLFLKRAEGSWKAGFFRYVHHPVMLASLFVIILVRRTAWSKNSGFQPYNADLHGT
jgi:hypothetical protein